MIKLAEVRETAPRRVRQLKWGAGVRAVTPHGTIASCGRGRTSPLTSAERTSVREAPCRREARCTLGPRLRGPRHSLPRTCHDLFEPVTVPGPIRSRAPRHCDMSQRVQCRNVDPGVKTRASFRRP
jgi:hypothetical protein